MESKKLSNEEIMSSINASINPISILSQMDEILAGLRKTCSTVVMSKEHGNKLTDEILKYVFEDYLGMSPTDVRDKLTPEIVDLLKLKQFIQNRIPCPVELNQDTELQYIAWYLYPETKNASNEQLIIKVYLEILSGKRKKYPKYFFDDIRGENRAKILLKTMINEFICPESIEELYELFANSKRIIPLLDKYGLRTPLNCIFITPLEFLHEALGKQGDEFLYSHYKTPDDASEDDDLEFTNDNNAAFNKNAAVEIIVSDIPDVPDISEI